MSELSFTTYFTTKNRAGAFTDPFYPWIEYSYRLTTGGCELEPGQKYPVSFHMKNVRSDMSQFSGEVVVEIGIGGKAPSSKHVKYNLGSGDLAAICANQRSARLEKDTICLTVRHICQSNIVVYNSDITHSDV